MNTLPPGVIAQIGSHLNDADRNACRCAAKVFADVHANIRDHRIIVRNATAFAQLTAEKCRVIARLKPALSQLTIVFKNIVGRPRLDPAALAVFQRVSVVELAFEYCDEEFMGHVLSSPWPCTIAYLWFHNGTTRDVPEELRQALLARKCPFATRFNAAQAASFLSDSRLVELMQSVTYAVQPAQPAAFTLDPHIIALPITLPDVHLDLRNYNIHVVHPHRVRSIRFGAQWAIDNDHIQAHRDRLRSWFNAETLKTNALEYIEVFGLSLQDFHNAEKCFARHMLQTLRATGSRCQVRFYNVLHHALLGLIRDFMDLNLCIVCKTAETWLCAHLMQCFLHPMTLNIKHEDYTPPEAWRMITNNVHALYNQLTPLLKSEWFWVNYTR